MSKKKEGGSVDFKPWNYQEYAINHILDNKASGLFLPTA